MARALADAGLDAVYSYAGRTDTPRPQPLPTRTGGFGGIDGLARYLHDARISHVVDATHPFAATMSRNAVAACAATGTMLCALERPEWVAEPGDRWQRVADLDAARAALPDAPARIFLAIGRQHLDAFASAPCHHYLLRLVDPPRAPLPLPQATVVIDRGPFDRARDRDLLRTHRIDLIVAKNAGGEGARAKLMAARDLSLPVLMVDRPAIPPRTRATTPGDVLRWIAHSADLGV